MPIWNRLFRPRNATNGDAYRFFLGNTSAGKRVNERTSMQMTAVYACVRILSESVSTLPLHLYHEEAGGSREKAIDHPLYSLMSREPNNEMTSIVMLETMMTHLLLWGNSYSQVIRNGRGEVLGIYPLMPDRMKVDRDEKKRLYYEYTVSNDDADTMKGKESTVRLSPEDVLHIPGLGFDGLVGYSPIAMAKNAIGLAIAAEEYGSKLFANGARPSGVLQHPDALKNYDNLRKSWEDAFGGSNNSNKVAILEQGVTYHPISINPEEAQFLETRRFQTEEIARIFRVPLHLLGDLDHATFSNVENQSLDFVKFTLTPWVCRIEASLNRRLLSDTEKDRYYFKFNLDGLLRGDYESRQRGYAVARQNGWMSMNDIRALENLPPVPDELGGNLYLVNGNMVPVHLAGLPYFKNGEIDQTEKSDHIEKQEEKKTDG